MKLWTATRVAPRRTIAACVAGLLALGLTATAAHSAKFFDSFFGATGATGGLFATANSGVGDVAVNDASVTTDGAGQSGWVYVVDRGNNRVQAFDSNHNFQFAVGRDVVNGVANPGAAGDTSETQTVTLGGAPTGGTFTLTFGAVAPTTTAPIAFDAPASGDPNSVQTRLEALGGIGVGNVNVSGPAGGPYAVAFVGARASVDHPQMTASGAGLTPAGTAAVATTQDGASFEKCTVAAQCKVGTTTATATLGNRGTFNIAQGIDIDQATGNFYVSERTTNRRIQQFTATGAFVRAFGWDITASGPGNTGGFETCNVAAGDVCQASSATGSNAGQFASNANVHGVAVAPPGAPNAGQVYVADPGNQRVQRFTVPSSATAAVQAGAPFGNSTQFGTGWPRDVAADPNGIVYATHGGSGSASGTDGQIARFDGDPSVNAFKTTISPTADDAWFGRSTPVGLEIDQSTGHLYVGRNPSDGIPGRGLLELDLSGDPLDVGPSHVVGLYGSGLGVVTATPNGIGINSANGNVYLSTTASSTQSPPGSGTGARVAVLDDNGVDPPPTVELLPAFDPTTTTAVLSAEINPNGPTGFPTYYRFQVSKNGINWTDVGSNALVGATGDGGTTTTVAQTATGLEANTRYQYRVVTSRLPDAGTTTSAEQTVYTDPGAPTVSTPAAQQISARAAQLVGKVNPNGLATEYWFEWGDTDYGNQVPVPEGQAGSGSVALSVAQQLAGLDPERIYHFRLCARNALTPSNVCSPDQSFQTRPNVDARGERAYEMVTSPDKALRRGGEGGAAGPDFARLTTGVATPDGDSLAWAVFGGISDPDAGSAFTNDRTWEIRRRTASGWKGQAAQTVAPLGGASAAAADIKAVSSDLSVQVWVNQASVYASGGQLSTHVMGDDGGPRGAGWYPILDQQWFNIPFANISQMSARVADSGTMHTSWSTTDIGLKFRAILPSDGGSRPTDLVPPQLAGQALFALRSPDWRPTDLVNECTGATADGDATELPARVGTGAPADTIGARACEAGSPTSVRGAMMSGTTGISDRLDSFAPRMVSEDGRRVFFLSPDPDAAQAPDYNFALVGGNGRTACAGQYLTPASALAPAATGALTACPAQLFVKQYDANGDAAVRWISRAEDALFDAPQGIEAFGNGASFEGASRDGRVVYFRTNAPLTTDDPNGGGSPVAGPASHLSWDLYRYQLPAAGDPADGLLTRISAGPGATAVGDISTGSDMVTNLDTTDGQFTVGAAIVGLGIPAGATIDAVGDSSLTLSSPATATRVQSAVSTRSADPNTNCGVAAADCGGADSSPDSQGALGNGVGGAARYISNDGNRVYFVTTGRMGGADAPWNEAPEGGVTTAGGSTVGNVTTRNLYLYDATKTGAEAYSFVARLPFNVDITKHAACATAATNAGGAPRRSFQASSTDPARLYRGQIIAPNCVHGTTSGDAVVFETAARLTSDDQDDAADVYMYDAPADELVRVSAPPAGSTPYSCLDDGTVCNGDLGVQGGNGGEMTTDGGSSVGTDGLSHFNLAEDEAGKLTAIYFETRIGLVPQDTNGDHMDVYEWRGGELTLISPGNSADSAFYSGSSRSGRDVFFATEQPIDSREIDTDDGDIYNARVGGGFPLPAPPPTVCGVLVDGCQGAGGIRATAPIDGGTGGNASPQERGELRVAALSSAARRRAARTGRVSLRINASVPGVVTIVGESRLGKKSVVVGRSTARFRRAGTKTVGLNLSKRARDHIRQGRPLRLRVLARAKGAHERAMTVTLRRSR